MECRIQKTTSHRNFWFDTSSFGLDLFTQLNFLDTILKIFNFIFWVMLIAINNTKMFPFVITEYITNEWSFVSNFLFFLFFFFKKRRSEKIVMDIDCVCVRVIYWFISNRCHLKCILLKYYRDGPIITALDCEARWWWKTNMCCNHLKLGSEDLHLISCLTAFVNVWNFLMNSESTLSFILNFFG